MNCLLVINKLSGNSSHVNEDALIKSYAGGDNVSITYILSPADTYSVNGYDKLIVCGGDGTLNHAINLCKNKAIDIYYLPYGTFNETAKGTGGKGIMQLAKMGRIGGVDFAYVAAAGSFTAIGQAASTKLKRRFKVFAYLSKVLSAYKVHRIEATVSGDVNNQGVFTLIMLSNSKRCFGFRFNRLHKHASDEMQLLLIKAPKRNNLCGKIAMFFPFFRAFFIGFSKPHHGKYVTFDSVKNISVNLAAPCKFCVDGESVTLNGNVNAAKVDTCARVMLIKE